MYLLSPSDDKLARKMEQSLREVRAEYEAMGGCSSLSRARPGFQKLFAEMELGTKQLQGEKDSKPTFLVVGKTGSGKSSLINALTKVHMAEVGTGPQTGGATAFDGKELGTFIDTPGWSEEGCPKELRSRNAWRQHNDATRLKTLREVVERYRPDGIIYCVTPATLNSQEIAEDLQRLVGIKNLVDSITGVRSSLLAILTKADTDLGPRVVKDSAEHHRLTHRRLRTLKETIKHFQMLNPGSPATSSLRPVAICSCVAKYKLIDGQPDFCSCDVSKVREEMQADSKLVSTIRKAHLEALEKQSISTGNSVIWYHAVLSVFLSYLPFLDVLMCYANLEKMLRLLSFTSPGAGRGACREKNKFACYKADFLCMSLFVTTIRLLALLVAVMIPFKTNAFFPWVTPCMVVVFTVVIGALLNGLTTLHIGYAALHDFCDSHSLLALMITALRDRYSGKQSPSDVYTPLSPVAFECMEQKPKFY